MDDGAESKFGTQKELIVLNILKYKHCVNTSREMSPFEAGQNTFKNGLKHLQKQVKTPLKTG